MIGDCMQSWDFSQRRRAEQLMFSFFPWRSIIIESFFFQETGHHTIKHYLVV